MATDTDTDTDLVLVAVDSTEKAREAAEYAVAVATQYEADLHLLHLLEHRLLDGLQSGDVPDETVASKQRAVTDEVRQLLPADGSVGFSFSGAAGYSVTQLGRTPGSVILDVAEALHADFLVVPRVTPTATEDEVIGEAALYVLEYASQPVLSV